MPDPGDYRKSLWSEIGMANGPSTWDDLLTGGAEINSKQGVQLGLGMSQEIDSNMAGRALLWSYGGSVQDENGKVTLNSPETVAAVEFMKKLFDQAMTPEVFSWTAASNNQGLVAGKLSYILNSISAYRSAQLQSPKVAEDVLFLPALKGPAGPDRVVARDAQLDRPVVLEVGRQRSGVHAPLHGQLRVGDLLLGAVRLLGFPTVCVPQLDGWLQKDPFGSVPGRQADASWAATP